MKVEVLNFIRWVGAALVKMGMVLVDVWPINLLIVSVSLSWHQGDNMLILAILVMVVVDVITKIGSIICLKVADTTGVEPKDVGLIAIFTGFWGAISKDKGLSSRGLFDGVSRKIALYGCLGLFALLIGDHQPPKGSLDVLQILSDSIYAVLIVVELLSILENFKDAGCEEVDFIKNMVCNLSDKAGFGKVSALMKEKDRKKGEGEGKQ